MDFTLNNTVFCDWKSMSRITSTVCTFPPTPHLADTALVDAVAGLLADFLPSPSADEGASLRFAPEPNPRLFDSGGDAEPAVMARAAAAEPPPEGGACPPAAPPPRPGTVMPHPFLRTSARSGTSSRSDPRCFASRIPLRTTLSTKSSARRKSCSSASASRT